MSRQLIPCSLGGDHRHYGGVATATNCPLYAASRKSPGKAGPVSALPPTTGPESSSHMDRIGQEPLMELVAPLAPPRPGHHDPERFTELDLALNEQHAAALHDLEYDDVLRLRDELAARGVEVDDYDFDPAWDFAHAIDLSAPAVSERLQTKHGPFYEAVQTVTGRAVPSQVMADEPGMFSDEQEAASYWREMCKNWAMRYGYMSAEEGMAEGGIGGWGEDEDSALIEQQYRNTQKWLADRGIESITLHRGMGWTEDSEDWERDMNSMPDFAQNSGEVEVGGHDLSSWTYVPEIARHFAEGDYEPTDHGIVMTVEMPASRILSLPGIGGFGSMAEGEVVCMTPGRFRANVEVI